MVKKSFRYKNIGIHSELLKKLLVPGWSWHRDFKKFVPKPESEGEFLLFSKLIYGIELHFEISGLYNHLKEYSNRNLILERFFKLNNLKSEKPDSIPGKLIPGCRIRDNKMVLLSFSYQCIEYHDKYYDNKFNYEVFNSCYELDSSFWKHTLGELYCGGIAAHSYGQIEVTSLKEYDRLLKLFEKRKDIRKSFLSKINKFKEMDNAYDILSPTEEKFLERMKEFHTGNSPLLRKFMSVEEKKLANSLFKMGKLTKGHSDDRYGSVIFYYED